MRPAALRSLTSFAALATFALAGCGGGLVDGGERPGRTASLPPVQASPAPGGTTFGKGPVKVALILPLGAAGQGAVAAASLRNAAELAMSEFEGAEITLTIEDDKGTADGAREAAARSLDEGADLILGPLFAPSVAAAGTAARAGGKPLIGFSTDIGTASRGVYLLSFLPQTEVERILDHAANSGRRSLGALIPDTTYGSVVEAQFREGAAKRGLRVAAVERYAVGQPGPAVSRLAPVFAGGAPQIDALLIPDSGEGLAAAGAALTSAGFDPARVKPLGTGLWNDPRALQVKALQGGWFAAPDQAGFAAFSTRYRAKFGAEPTRIATLAYDAVSLAAALARTPGAARFSDATLTNPSGFAGADGVFRFRPDGSSERALAVHEVRNGVTAVVSPAPKALGPSGI